jgi:hypothetical protein
VILLAALLDTSHAFAAPPSLGAMREADPVKES